MHFLRLQKIQQQNQQLGYQNQINFGQLIITTCLKCNKISNQNYYNSYYDNFPNPPVVQQNDIIMINIIIIKIITKYYIFNFPIKPPPNVQNKDIINQYNKLSKYFFVYFAI
eukprot:TRINITY_DN9630_c3_g1_i2.p4 TRINITY_DN9630_c3_g1~~TRINITY_DN9630_c3_g1_i2.p4  ORF type:complete len:112 (+),score=1.21 TRINITY_DN9630_c3_g1_i2:330-665(+)